MTILFKNVYSLCHFSAFIVHAGHLGFIPDLCESRPGVRMIRSQYKGGKEAFVFNLLAMVQA